MAAEFPGNSFMTTEECKQCGMKPAVLLHNVLHKGQFLHICTGCVLRLHQGSFCPICFTVYEDQYNLPEGHVKCSSCDGVYHVTCVPSLPLFTILPPTTAASSSSSSGGNPYRVVCPYCSDPNLKLFEFSRDEATNAVKIDVHASTRMLAAATISNRSMKKAEKIASVKAQIMSKEAAEAKQEAKEALEKVHNLSLEIDEDEEEEEVEEEEDEDSGPEDVASDDDGGGPVGGNGDEADN